MSRNYYVLSNGRVRREANTVYVESGEGGKKPLPVEDVDSLYLFGEVDLNTRLLNFLSQRKIALHVFNYYGFYAGSYYPREYLHSGFLLVHQVGHYSDVSARMTLARELVRASAHSLLRNVAYYERRRAGAAAASPSRDGGESGEGEPEGEVGLATDTPLLRTGVPTDAAVEEGVDAGASLAVLNDTGDSSVAETPEADPLAVAIDFDTGLDAAGQEVSPLLWLRTTLEGLAGLVEAQTEVNALRGVEGKMRERYYQCWRHIVGGEWVFDRRVRRPPDNEVNALISFGNSMLYTVCLSEIYRTQLTPTISYLHEPGARRFSLALDLSEIFKPLIVDRTIFRLLNTGQVKESHFDRSMKGCFLTDAGKKLFLGALEERLATTIKHRRLNRHVSYRHLIRLECYKLIRHLTGVEPYRAFRAWW